MPAGCASGRADHSARRGRNLARTLTSSGQRRRAELASVLPKGGKERDAGHIPYITRAGRVKPTARLVRALARSAPPSAATRDVTNLHRICLTPRKGIVCPVQCREISNGHQQLSRVFLSGI